MVFFQHLLATIPEKRCYLDHPHYTVMNTLNSLLGTF
jgi:hypothetical protein